MRSYELSRLRAVDQLRQLEREQVARQKLPEPKAEHFDCETHVYTAPRWIVGQPHPHEGMGGCPKCRNEEARRRKEQHERPSTVTVPHPEQTREAGLPPGMQAAYLLKRRERLKASGCVVPGSSEEEEALGRIDALRDELDAHLSDTPSRRRKRHRTYWRSHARI